MKEATSKTIEAVLELHVDRNLSVFQISNMLVLDPIVVHRIIKLWSDDRTPLEVVKLLKAPEKEDTQNTMAKKDKNKQEREEQMAKLREGDVCYGVDMDKIRGLLPELQEGEIFLIHKQTHSKDRVNIRLGDYAI
ncbi:MAG: hypothetical protein ACYSW8_21780 [Planctomycetota bacterium]|jgi:hypothetical protein